MKRTIFGLLWVAMACSTDDGAAGKNEGERDAGVGAAGSAASPVAPMSSTTPRTPRTPLVSMTSPDAGQPNLPPPGAACDDLRVCCAALAGDERKGCDGIRAAGNAAACAAASTALCRARPAATPPPPVVPPPAAADPCVALEACCASLADEEDQEDCEEGLADADPIACQASVDEACPGTPTAPGVPGSDPCVALNQCCATLIDEEDQEDCTGVVEEADATACTQSAADYCTTVPTVPTVPTPGVPGSDPCATLTQCCSALADEEDQEECTEVVEEADPAACTESAADYCMSTVPGTPPPPPEDD